MQSAAERALERQIRAIEAGQYGTYPHPSYEQLHRAVANDDDQTRTANSPYLQGAFIAMDPRHGRRSRAGRRPRFRRQQVQSRDAGPSSAGIDVQADRLRRRDSERSAAVVPPRRFAADRRSRQRTAVAAEELRGRLRRQDSDASRALSVAQRADDSPRHRARHAERDRRGAEVRPHDADPGLSVDLHRRGRRLPDRDGRGVFGVRHARHSRDADRDHRGRRPEGQYALGAAADDRARACRRKRRG